MIPRTDIDRRPAVGGATTSAGDPAQSRLTPVSSGPTPTDQRDAPRAGVRLAAAADNPLRCGLKPPCTEVVGPVRLTGEAQRLSEMRTDLEAALARFYRNGKMYPVEVPKPFSPEHETTIDRDALVERLRTMRATSGRLLFTISDAGSGVVRARAASFPGYPGAVSFLIPSTYRKDAAGGANLHLHGYILNGNLDQEVFDGYAGAPKLAATVAASGSPNVVVVPESPGHNTVFRNQWGREGDDRGNATRFDAFMTNVARTLGVQHLGPSSVTTHSGSGPVGDFIVSATQFGRSVRYRGHIDDGYGDTNWRARFNADQSVLARGGWVYSIARDNYGSSNDMNAAHYLRSHPDYRFDGNRDYNTWRDASGETWHVIKRQFRVPTQPYGPLEQPTHRLTNVLFTEATGAHWALNRELMHVWGMARREQAGEVVPE